jgi:hypothetical protein
MRHNFIIFFFFTCLFCSAQGFRTRQYFPASLANLTKTVFETTPGNYVAGGFIHDSVRGHYSNRLCLVGLNSQGQVQWTKKYGNYQFEYLNNIFISRWFYKQGNNLYFTSGALDSNNKTVGVLLKFDFNGDTLWQKVYRDTADDVAPQHVTGSVDGGFLMTGFFQNTYSAAMILKTDANGNELWRKKIHKLVPDAEDGRAIVQDSATKRIVTVGYQYIGNASTWQGYNNILILDSLGNLQSRHSYGPENSIFFDLIQTSDKNFVAVGDISQGFQIGGYDALKNYAVKIDINNPALPVWSLETGIASTGTYFSCVTELNNGDLLMGGHLDTMELHNLPYNCLMRHTKISQNGLLLSNRFYNYKTNAPSVDNVMDMHCLTPTSDGGLITAIEVSNTGVNPFFIVKYDSTGCDSTLAYCAAGPTTGIKRAQLPDESISIYPNPSTGVLNINFKNSSKDILTAAFMDIYGRELKRVQLEKTENNLDLKSLSNGVYVVKISNDKNELLYQSKLLKLD